MAQLLYITANPKPPEKSVGLTVGQIFIDMYRESHPDDQIIHFDLYKEYVPTIDEDVLEAWNKLRKHDVVVHELSPEQQLKLNAIEKIIGMMFRADKYVFLSPMWNWGIPPKLKAFIDSFIVVNKTFKYTPKGPVGFLTDKKAIHIQSSGGIYSEGNIPLLDFSHPFLRQVLSVAGIKDFKGLLIEGSELYPDRADEIKRNAIEKAKEMALRF